jgi:hypothetical protein
MAFTSGLPVAAGMASSPWIGEFGQAAKFGLGKLVVVFAGLCRLQASQSFISVH